VQENKSMLRTAKRTRLNFMAVRVYFSNLKKIPFLTSRKAN
jgi:hypothetical protein